MFLRIQSTRLRPWSLEVWVPLPYVSASSRRIPPLELPGYFYAIAYGSLCTDPISLWPSLQSQISLMVIGRQLWITTQAAVRLCLLDH